MRLLILNLRTDVDHTALGFTTAWINALALRWDTVEVITMHQGRLDLAPNVRVHSLGRERGASRVRRAVNFYRSAWQIASRRRPDACFAHMTPLLVLMFWPVAKVARIPVLLWYAHGSVTRELRVAHALADRCATSTTDGFRIPSRKLAVLGQGIDTETFRPSQLFTPGQARTVLSIGRLTASKHLEEALEALVIVRAQTDLVLRVVGGPVSDIDGEYQKKMHALADQLGLDHVVEFAGPVSFALIPAEYRNGAIFLNLSSTGSLDKAILEAMASGCIPVSRNDAFRRQIAERHGLDELVPGPGVDGVAECLATIARLSGAAREQLSLRLRAIVIEEHGLDRLAGRLDEELRDLARH